MSTGWFRSVSRRTLLAAVPGLALGVLLPRAARANVRASAMRLGDHGNTTRLVLDLDGAVTWRLFTLASPYRIVLDVPDLVFAIGSLDMPRPVGLVQGARHGFLEAGTSRLVVDLHQPALIDKAFLLEPRDGQGWRLVVDMVRSSHHAFMETVGSVMQAEAPQTTQPVPTTVQPAYPSGQLAGPRSVDEADRVEVSSTTVASADPSVGLPGMGAGAGAVASDAATGAPISLLGHHGVRPPEPAGEPSRHPAPQGGAFPEPLVTTPSPTTEGPVSSTRVAAVDGTAPPLPPLGAKPGDDPYVSGLPLGSADEPPFVRIADGRRVPVPLNKPPVPERAWRKPVIVLDPGHGGRDPGAISPAGHYEKNITLAMARELRQTLENTGRYKVLLTRSRDSAIRLRDRVAKGRHAGADLFISLHADALGDSSVRGLSIYTLSENASDAEAEALAERENKADILLGMDLSNESQDVANILIDLAQRETKNRSVQFANTMISSLPSDIKTLGKPRRFAGFAVLKAPDVPSVLVEMGFLSNRTDEKLLRTSAYRAKLASAMVLGVDAFFAPAQQRAWKP